MNIVSDGYTDATFSIDDNGVALFTMNRPDILNALTDEMKAEFVRMLDTVQGNEDVKVLIVAANGRAFSAGGNVKAMGEPTRSVPVNTRTRLLKLHDWFERLHNLDCPVIAAVDGMAFGGGFAVALQADFILASDRAKFCAVFGRIGLVPDMAVFYTLPRAVGMQNAKELMYTARSITAQEADAMGLLFSIHQADDLMPAAHAMAARLAKGSKHAMGVTKKIVNRSFQSDYATMAEMEADAQAIVVATDFHQEAVRRFQNKETPMYNWDAMEKADGVKE
jgi:2-(1,2-epoxy-1,2-dihydrophenyl)acetyl-CoA isomerase